MSGLLSMLAFNPDGTMLAGVDTAGFAYLWDPATGQEITRIRHSEPVTSVTFSPEGSQLITVSRKIVRVWDLDAIEPLPLDQLVTIACGHLTANLSRTQWTNLFGDEEYRLLCPELP